MSERDAASNPPPLRSPECDYEPPAILWEDELPQGPNLFSACGKIAGQGEVCSATAAS
jgi:hypothetical protein